MLSRDTRRAWPPGAFPSRPPIREALDPTVDAVSGLSGRTMLQLRSILRSALATGLVAKLNLHRQGCRHMTVRCFMSLTFPDKINPRPSQLYYGALEPACISITFSAHCM